MAGWAAIVLVLFCILVLCLLFGPVDDVEWLYMRIKALLLDVISVGMSPF